ncbi:MAG: hypothetical protein D6788_09480 [Planctomycetota bacterium]|nr:MAG: hypothetical protein D6788_09480 [Planctomycetota bacterium]
MEILASVSFPAPSEPFVLHRPRGKPPGSLMKHHVSRINGVIGLTKRCRFATLPPRGSLPTPVHGHFGPQAKSAPIV